VNIPSEVLAWIKTVFLECNIRITTKLWNIPNTPEESLDMTWIEHLTQYSSPIVLDSGWIIRLETHYLGGLRHFYTWEIADIGVLVFVRRDGKPLGNKVALLQSKRLYPLNSQVREELRIDYETGFARLADPENMIGSKPVVFEFNENCTYGALAAGSQQVNAIVEYQRNHESWVYYQFYNPWTVPSRREVPLDRYEPLSGVPEFGVRVARSDDVHAILAHVSAGSSPSPKQLTPLPDRCGWRLEDFVADLLLGCREGASFGDVNQPSIQDLFFRRSGPIAAAISISIEAPSG
jgi:hypothetical protein